MQLQTLLQQLIKPINNINDNVIIIYARDGELAKLQNVYIDLKNASVENERLKMIFETSNRYGKSPLHEAAQNGQFECCRFLLDMPKVDIDLMKQSDWTPLMLAMTKRSIETIRILLQFHANTRLQNKHGWTAFHIGCRTGYLPTVECLLEADLDLWNTRSKNGRTPLHTAVLYGLTEIVDLLLPKMNLVDPVDSCGSTPLMEAFRVGRLDIVRSLLNHSCDINKRDSCGRSVLHIAAEAGQSESVKYAVDHLDFDPDELTSDGQCALHFAAKEGHSNTLRTLSKLNCNINIVDQGGRNALHMAASGGHTETIAFLLSININNVKDNAGKLPIDYARKNNVKDLFNRR